MALATAWAWAQPPMFVPPSPPSFPPRPSLPPRSSIPTRPNIPPPPSRPQPFTAVPAPSSAPTAPVAPTIGQAQIRVLVNGKPVRFDVPPMLGGGGVYVPLRGVFEEIGATVDFDRASGQVTARRGKTVVDLKVGSKLAHIDGETAFMLQPALYKGGRTLVPLRFVSQALGATVDWNPVRREVEITVSDATPRKSAPRPR